jgi:hypothetical protein
MTTIGKLFTFFVAALCLAACSEQTNPEADVFTLYSTNFPDDDGRTGVATFDLAKEPFNIKMCQEAAELYQEDFEKRRMANNWTANAKMRYWCEKGRFRN